MESYTLPDDIPITSPPPYTSERWLTLGLVSLNHNMATMHSALKKKKTVDKDAFGRNTSFCFWVAANNDEDGMLETFFVQLN